MPAGDALSIPAVRTAQPDSLIPQDAAPDEFTRPAASDARLAAPVAARSRRRVAFWLALVWIAIVAVAAVTASWLPLPDPNKQDLTNRLTGPFSSGHVLGTDALGRDVLSRLAFGARVSLTIGLVAVAIGMVIGGTLGMIVGYFRGLLESTTMWALNVLLAFPGLVLLLGLVAFVGQSLTAITLVVGFLSIPTYARVARATTLSVAQRDFVLSARAMGATHRRILFREILPNVVLPLSAFALVAIGVVIVLEGSLAFLGLSVQAPDPTWGSMIAEGRPYMTDLVWAVLTPSLAMFSTVLAVNFVGDDLRSRFDVKESNL